MQAPAADHLRWIKTVRGGGSHLQISNHLSETRDQVTQAARWGDGQQRSRLWEGRDQLSPHLRHSKGVWLCLWTHRLTSPCPITSQAGVTIQMHPRPPERISAWLSLAADSATEMASRTAVKGPSVSAPRLHGFKINRRKLLLNRTKCPRHIKISLKLNVSEKTRVSSKWRAFKNTLDCHALSMFLTACFGFVIPMLLSTSKGFEYKHFHVFDNCLNFCLIEDDFN